MADREGDSRMKPVHADDVRPERQLWQSPKRLLVAFAVFIIVWTAMFVAISWLHVPLWVAVSVGVVITLAVAAAEIISWRRGRRS